ncbi:hypothetical protein B0H17DRAFT_1184204 [Mycena rosella]|uniref:Uncharacterized protein n=1 Tax=Mycena rosella TaxID=1033263 RepID=A0AAD7CWL2_MYCRO|nr:hypothetical protein B0H17DRAFT_1184204 [Mycena rosella]
MHAVRSRGKYATSQKPPRKMSGTRKYGPLVWQTVLIKTGYLFPTDYPDSVLIAIAIPHESPAEIGRLLCGFRIKRDALVQNMEQTIQLRATFTMEKGNCLVGYDTIHRQAVDVTIVSETYQLQWFHAFKDFGSSVTCSRLNFYCSQVLNRILPGPSVELQDVTEFEHNAVNSAVLS